ncbi:siderophore ABC transporter substrate-binding protein [Paenibacillus thailandensis]|uniref:Siderophore ABC transporter substrate-binding protein n=1 Tax=Paenibacillus thailandensis TaxID=393250 RepID=A0ABW5R3V9_9BACL
MKKLSLLLVLMAFAIVTAACGGNSGSGNGAGSTASPSPTASSEASPSPAASAAPAELTITDRFGDHKIKTNPEKVVVFDFGTLDTLDKLGVEVTGVPSSNLPGYLSKYEDEKYVNVGGLMEPDFEKIAEIQPDLIIISGRQADSYEEFNKIAPTIYMGVDTEKYMESFKANVTTLGQIFGKEAEAEKELAAVEASIKELNEKVTAAGNNALVVLTTSGKVSAFGTGSRFGIIHDVFGFTPVDPSVKVTTHGNQVSFEYIAEKNPDYLFVVDRDAVVSSDKAAQPAAQVIENDLVKNTNAYKNGRIVYLNPDYWYLSGGGLVSVSEMVNEVSAGLK